MSYEDVSDSRVDCITTLDDATSIEFKPYWRGVGLALIADRFCPAQNKLAIARRTFYIGPLEVPWLLQEEDVEFQKPSGYLVFLGFGW